MTIDRIYIDFTTEYKTSKTSVQGTCHITLAKFEVETASDPLIRDNISKNICCTSKILTDVWRESDSDVLIDIQSLQQDTAPAYNFK